MCTLVKVIPSPTTSDATTLLQESSAALEATYAAKRGGLVCTPIEEMFTMWLRFCSRITGKSRSEEHTSELQSLMRISYAVFCLKKKKDNTQRHLQVQ